MSTLRLRFASQGTSFTSSQSLPVALWLWDMKSWSMPASWPSWAWLTISSSRSPQLLSVWLLCWMLWTTVVLVYLRLATTFSTSLKLWIVLTLTTHKSKNAVNVFVTYMSKEDTLLTAFRRPTTIKSWNRSNARRPCLLFPSLSLLATKDKFSLAVMKQTQHGAPTNLRGPFQTVQTTAIAIMGQGKLLLEAMAEARSSKVALLQIAMPQPTMWPLWTTQRVILFHYTVRRRQRYRSSSYYFLALIKHMHITAAMRRTAPAPSVNNNGDCLWSRFYLTHCIVVSTKQIMIGNRRTTFI